MANAGFKPEQIIHLLREGEVLIAQEKNVPQVFKPLGISNKTYYRRRKEYGCLRIDQPNHP